MALNLVLTDAWVRVPRLERAGLQMNEVLIVVVVVVLLLLLC